MPGTRLVGAVLPQGKGLTPRWGTDVGVGVPNGLAPWLESVRTR